MYLLPSGERSSAAGVSACQRAVRGELLAAHLSAPSQIERRQPECWHQRPRRSSFRTRESHGTLCYSAHTCSVWPSPLLPPTPCLSCSLRCIAQSVGETRVSPNTGCSIPRRFISFSQHSSLSLALICFHSFFYLFYLNALCKAVL